jgi:hypothetical protein
VARLQAKEYFGLSRRTPPESHDRLQIVKKANSSRQTDLVVVGSREADLSGVPEYGAGVQIDFTNGSYIAGRPGELAGATDKVHRVTDDREQAV